MAVLLQGCCPVQINSGEHGGKVCKGFFSFLMLAKKAAILFCL